MKRDLLIAALVAIGIFASSCSSTVRFAENASPKDYEPRSIEKVSPKKETTAKRDDLPKSEIQKKIVKNADTWLGTPYAWGGNTKSGVDCSGFVKQVYSTVGYDLPRTAATQYEYSEKISTSELKCGDLVFFKKNDKISHVGIYIGGNEIIHSASGKGVVRQSFSDTYLQSIYYAAGRVLSKR